MSNSLESIYNEIVQASSDAEKKKTAIVYFLKPYGFKNVDTDPYNDVICRYELIEGNQKIVAWVESYDHSRTGQLRPDSNHNYLELYDGNKRLKSYHYVFWDDI